MKKLILLSAFLCTAPGIAQENVSIGRLSVDGTILVGPDPGKLIELFPLLREPQVVQILGIKPEQIAGVSKVVDLSSARMREAFETYRERGGDRTQLKAAKEENQSITEAAITEILLPQQLTQLRQLAYRMEIRDLGWPRSITSGRFADSVGIYEDQKQELFDRATRIVIEMEKQIEEARRAAEQKILAELVPEQRKRVEGLIGPFVYLRTLSSGEKQRMRLEEKHRQRSTQNDELP